MENDLSDIFIKGLNSASKQNINTTGLEEINVELITIPENIMTFKDYGFYTIFYAGKASMKGIYTSCISKDTLDEAPFAYRDIDYIKKAVEDTVTITKILKPVYNYKGGNA